MENNREFSFVFRTRFGPLTLLWRESSTGPTITRIALSRERVLPARRRSTGHAPTVSSPKIAALAETITRFLDGVDVGLPLSIIDLDGCSRFQRRVLLEESRIPRGRVSTYGRIASRLGAPGSGRAVGRALATNPFPLIIPCHRAIRADGTLGGYRGGPDMKRRLLLMEGVRFDAKGRVLGEYVV